MAVLDPLKVVISGLPELLKEVNAPDFPQDPQRGSHVVPVDSTLYIDSQDFRLVDEPVRA